MSLGAEPSGVPVISTTVTLMELFKQIAKRNLLAFSMVVDIFERSSYLEQDPLAHLLRQGGQETAARQADIHREINDSGEHENAALDFLSHMMAVNGDYAREALRLTELATLTIHQLSTETLETVR